MACLTNHLGYAKIQHLTPPTHFNFDGDTDYLVAIYSTDGDLGYLDISNGSYYRSGLGYDDSMNQDPSSTYSTSNYIDYLAKIEVYTGEGGGGGSSVGDIYFYHTDHLGTVRMISDEDGTVVWQKRYTPFGGEEEQSGSVENTYQFTGKGYDEDTGLYYFNARWYDPDMGRFISEDPLWGNIFDPQSLNRFAYGRNNPFKYVDPSGMKIDCRDNPHLNDGSADDYEEDVYGGTSRRNRHGNNHDYGNNYNYRLDHNSNFDLDLDDFADFDGGDMSVFYSNNQSTGILGPPSGPRWIPEGDERDRCDPFIEYNRWPSDEYRQNFGMYGYVRCDFKQKCITTQYGHWELAYGARTPSRTEVVNRYTNYGEAHSPASMPAAHVGIANESTCFGARITVTTSTKNIR